MTQTHDLDPFGDGDVAEVAPDVYPSDGSLAEVARLAAVQVSLIENVARLTAEFNAAVEALRANQEVELPRAMLAAGQTACGTVAGWVSVAEVVSAGISEANAPAAFEWLEGSGHGDLIKRKVTLSFGRGQGEVAGKILTALRARLAELDAEVPVDDKKSVHPGTLGAFVREQLARGVELPEAELGVFRVTRATVGDPPKRAKKKQVKAR